MLRWLTLVALLGLTGCPQQDGPGGRPPTSASDELVPEDDGSPPEPYDDWYPDDVSPPPGTQYPCALTALPKDLEGIPGQDHRYLNHVYSQVLLATQAKLVIYQELTTLDPDAMRAALVTYCAATDEARTKIEAEPIPDGLASFQDDVVQSISLQQEFFTEATEQLTAVVPEVRGAASDADADRIWQAAWKSAHDQIRPGREASTKLRAAWGRMQRRYPRWTPEVKDSIFHHLCALDLF
jgi:hypothetical protein